MRAALRGTYLEFAIFVGMNERYPDWLAEELYRCAYLDESRFTMWVPKDERRPDYHEKQLVEDFSVFLRKSNGDITVIGMDLFSEYYTTFRYDSFTNSGIVAFNEDCMEYVECRPGVLSTQYPDWFYEYFTEAMNHPFEETIYLYDTSAFPPKPEVFKHNKTPFMKVGPGGDVSVTSHCVFLCNRYGEIRGLEYGDFVKHYDPDPKLGG